MNYLSGLTNHKGPYEGEDGRWKQRSKSKEDARLLAVMMEEEALSQGMQVASSS